MKKIYLIFYLLSFVCLGGCAKNLMTGKSTMALVPNDQVFASSFQQYDEVLNESKVVKGTADAATLVRVGNKLVAAAQKWVTAQGSPDYFKEYKWEFTLIDDKTVNAWAMPGGKVVFYTGILPVTKNEAGIAVIMGHEISHAILNHGQQSMSAGILQQVGLTGASVLLGGSGLSETTQSLSMTALSAGSNVLGTLPFSRSNESEADQLGLILMTVAGYDPNEAVNFWQRMNALGGGGTPVWLSTHPSHDNRIKKLQELIPEARAAAAKLGVKGS